MGSHIIQKMYYPNNSPALWFEGVLRYRYASDQIESIDIIQDNSKQTLLVKQTSPIHIKWPHAKERFALAIKLKNGESVTLAQESGDWAMVKFLMMNDIKSPNERSKIIKIKHYNHHVELEFESQNTMTPLSANMQSFFQVPENIFQDKSS